MATPPPTGKSTAPSQDIYTQEIETIHEHFTIHQTLEKTHVFALQRIQENLAKGGSSYEFRIKLEKLKTAITAEYPKDSIWKMEKLARSIYCSSPTLDALDVIHSMDQNDYIAEVNKMASDVNNLSAEDVKLLETIQKALEKVPLTSGLKSALTELNKKLSVLGETYLSQKTSGRFQAPIDKAKAILGAIGDLDKKPMVESVFLCFQKTALSWVSDKLATETDKDTRIELQTAYQNISALSVTGLSPDDEKAEFVMNILQILTSNTNLDTDEIIELIIQDLPFGQAHSILQILKDNKDAINTELAKLDSELPDLSFMDREYTLAALSDPRNPLSVIYDIKSVMTQEKDPETFSFINSLQNDEKGILQHIFAGTTDQITAINALHFLGDPDPSLVIGHGGAPSKYKAK